MVIAKEKSSDPNLVWTIGVPWNIMLVGFRAAAKSYQIMLNNIHAESDTDKIK